MRLVMLMVRLSPQKLLLTTTQVLKICQAFTNCLSANIKLLKTQPSKMAQLERFLGIILPFLLSPNYVAKEIVENRGNIFSTLDKVINVANTNKILKILARTEFSWIPSSEIMLTKNEIKCIIKVMKYLKN